MNAWTIAKGILIASAVLMAVGVFMSAGMFAAGTAVIGSVVQQKTAEHQRSQPAVTKTVRVSDDIKRMRLQTTKGKELWVQCRDWRKVNEEYHLPSTQQGVERYCGELERYLNGVY